MLLLHPRCPSSEGQESRTQARLKSFLLKLGNMAIGDEERANGQQGKVREPSGGEVRLGALPLFWLGCLSPSPASYTEPFS